MTGSLTIVSGPAGSGKTTAIRAIAQVLPDPFVIDNVNYLLRMQDVLQQVSEGKDVLISWVSETPLTVRSLHMGEDL